MEYFGLTGLAGSFPKTLSGGERRKIAVIRAIANSPKIILAEEVTSSIDDENSQLLMELLKKNKQGEKGDDNTDDNRHLRKASNQQGLHSKRWPFSRVLMPITMRKVLVTGGAGFIGSHLVDALMVRGDEVCVSDNLSTGSLENVRHWLNSPNFTFIMGDLLNPIDLEKLKIERYSLIFHFAGNPKVKIGSTEPDIHFQQNIVATHNLLELVRKTGTQPTMAFASTSTIYGEASRIPTPEDYAPLKPISTYGASKLACEALITAYAYTYGFKAVIYRLANIVGPRSRHGVIYDFIQKLKRNPEELEILGDGSQTKSYLHIRDCVDAILLGLENSAEQVEIFNVGSEDQVDVKTIAQIVIEEMKLKNVKPVFTGGVEGGRGWKGNVKNMLLDITRLKRLGWKPRLNSKQAVMEAAKSLINENPLYKSI